VAYQETTFFTFQPVHFYQGLERPLDT